MTKFFTSELEPFFAKNRKWQGIPSVERTANGRIFVAFYSGNEDEQFGNFCVLTQRESGEHTFTEPIAVAYAGETGRCFDPCVWIDPRGRLWFLWSEMPNVKTWAVISDEPDALNLTWSTPFIVAEGVILNKPTVLRSGEWLFPSAVWEKRVFESMQKSCPNLYANPPTVPSLAYAIRTTDEGKTFDQLGGARSEHISYDEHQFLEQTDGTVVVYIRSGQEIEHAFSADKGETWSKSRGSGIYSPNSRFFISRLHSGRILLINHVGYLGRIRNNLTAQLSEDDGKTWIGGLLLDERNDVSYPDATEGSDGFIYAVYDRERGAKNQKIPPESAAKEILMAKFTENDILAGRLVSTGSSLKMIVSKLI